MTRKSHLPSFILGLCTCLWLGCSGSRPYQETDDEGRIISHGWLNDGRASGKWAFFNQQGATWLEGSFTDGSPTGIWHGSASNAADASTFRAHYNNGALDGPQWWWTNQKQLTAMGSYRQGRQHGPWLVYNNSKLTSCGSYQRGRQHGPWFYFSDNQPTRGGLLIDGKPIGPWLHAGAWLDRGIPESWQAEWYRVSKDETIWVGRQNNQLRGLIHIRRGLPVIIWLDQNHLAWTDRGPRVLGALDRDALILSEARLPTLYIGPNNTPQRLNTAGEIDPQLAINLTSTDLLRSTAAQKTATLQAITEIEPLNQALMQQTQLPIATNPVWQDPYLTAADIALLRPIMPPPPLPKQTWERCQWQQKAAVPSAIIDLSLQPTLSSKGIALALVLPDAAHLPAAYAEKWIAAWKQAELDGAALIRPGQIVTPSDSVLFDSDFSWVDAYGIPDQPTIVRINSQGDPVTLYTCDAVALPSPKDFQALKPANP